MIAQALADNIVAKQLSRLIADAARRTRTRRSSRRRMRLGARANWLKRWLRLLVPKVHKVNKRYQCRNG